MNAFADKQISKNTSTEVCRPGASASLAPLRHHFHEETSGKRPVTPDQRVSTDGDTPLPSRENSKRPVHAFGNIPVYSGAHQASNNRTISAPASLPSLFRAVPPRTSSPRLGAKSDSAETDASRFAERILSRSPQFADSPAKDRTPPSVAAGGVGLAESERNFFEPRLGKSLHQIGIHCDEAAARSARRLGANAFTLGSNIWFGSGQYHPGASSFRRTLAHELGHVAQSAAGFDSGMIRRTPGEDDFDWTQSRLAQAISAALDAIQAPTGLTDPETDEALYAPLINSEVVLRLLSESPLFLTLAESVENTYLSEPESSPLHFDFHLNAERPTEFMRGSGDEASVVSVFIHPQQAVTRRLALVVGAIVHELAHASHEHLPRVSTRGLGEVAITEARGVAEERNTRVEEFAIMDEIMASSSWQTLTMNARLNRPDTAEDITEASVRDSFRSGLPKLTYQEYFIVEVMLNRYRPESASDDDARHYARIILDQAGLPEVAPGNVARFWVYWSQASRMPTRDEQGGPEVAISAIETEALVELPPAPPPLEHAAKAIQIYNRHDRNLRRASAALNDVSPRCVDFIHFVSEDFHYRTLIDQGFEPLPADPDRRIDAWTTLMDMWSAMQERHDRRAASQTEAVAFMAWYAQHLQGVREEAQPEAAQPPETATRAHRREQARQDRLALEHREDQADQQLQALRYFAWVLISEKMSREWTSYDAPEASLQERHLQFLEEAAGAAPESPGLISGEEELLRGIPHP